METIIKIAEIAGMVAGIGFILFITVGFWMSATFRKFTGDWEEQSWQQQPYKSIH